MSKPWAPTFGDDEPNLSGAVYQALGTVSLCWSQIDDAGIFDTDQATWVAEGLLAFLTEHMREEYTIVWDGDPMMDGSHERQQMGTWPSIAQAQMMMGIVIERSAHAPKENLRIERRQVAPWAVVDV